MKIIEVENVSKSFSDRKVLDSVSFTIEKGLSTTSPAEILLITILSSILIAIIAPFI